MLNAMKCPFSSSTGTMAVFREWRQIIAGIERDNGCDLAMKRKMMLGLLIYYSANFITIPIWLSFIKDYDLTFNFHFMSLTSFLFDVFL